MTREGFIEVLEERGYRYVIEGDKIIITHKVDVYLRSLKTLPPDVEFKNGGSVYLESLLETLPPDVEFKNGGSVYLESLETLPSGVEFKNGGNVYWVSLKTISPGVEFKNGGNVYLGSLIGGWIEDWSGNIEGVDSKMLLNLMIKQGVFI